MNRRQQRLIINQLDQKIRSLYKLHGTEVPEKGWIHSLRRALNMSLRQVGNKLKVTPQALRRLEINEAEGKITLNSLREVAGAMNLKLVYALIPLDGSLQGLINKRAEEVARDIVTRTSQNMKLEDQENSQERIRKAITEKANELKDEMPKFLWD